MNLTEKIEKMELWMKVFTIVGCVMIVVGYSTFVWGETDENGSLIGVAGDVAVASVLVAGLMAFGVMAIVFMGLALCVQHSSENNR